MPTGSRAAGWLLYANGPLRASANSSGRWTTCTDPRGSSLGFREGGRRPAPDSVRHSSGRPAARYYEAHGSISICVLGRDQLEIVPLAPASRVREQFHLLQLQLSKFSLGPAYVRTCSEALSIASRAHLKKLYHDLVAPVRDRLRAQHLIVVPHQFLHYLPFHALFDGERFLVDTFSLSYMPSASLHYLHRTRRATPSRRSLVLGVPDRAAPHIRNEVRAVARCSRRSRVCRPEGDRAAVAALAPTSRVVHIATHGRFRQDNPILPPLRSERLSSGCLTCSNLDLSSELVTLSGCGTGLNVVTGGDELVGLLRGWLFAGVGPCGNALGCHDRSTTEFMALFYRCLRTSQDKALALQQAMTELRETFPHPYCWAPFVLIGALQTSGHTRDAQCG